jgi:hypothetical protein
MATKNINDTNVVRISIANRNALMKLKYEMGLKNIDQVLSALLNVANKLVTTTK